MSAPPPDEDKLKLKRAIKWASVFAFAAGILIALSPLPWYIRIPVSFVPLLAVTPLVKAWHRRRPRDPL
jgi:apolipoprotein N-acyltransferase